MLNEIIFLILAAIILVGALKMLTATELVHAVVYLGLVLAGVAGIYLTLSAEFLAAIQILVYVGAVVTLILFAVMLTTPAPSTEGYGEDKTPLSMLGIDAPRGMDVESLTEVADDATSVSDAEAAAGAAAGDVGQDDEADADPEEPEAESEETEDDDPETEEPTDTAADEAAAPDEEPAKAGDEEDV